MQCYSFTYRYTYIVDPVQDRSHSLHLNNECLPESQVGSTTKKQVIQITSAVADVAQQHLCIQLVAFMVVGWVQICIKFAELVLYGFLYRWQLYQLLQSSKLLQDITHALSTDWPYVGWLDLAATVLHTDKAQDGAQNQEKNTTVAYLVGTCNHKHAHALLNT